MSENTQVRKVRKPLRKRVPVVLAHVLLAVLAFIWLIPIFWVRLPASGAPRVPTAPLSSPRFTP